MFTFIPLDFARDPLGLLYDADGPGFSPERAKYRTRHRLIIDPSKVTPSSHLSGRGGLGATVVPPGFVIREESRVGLSVSYVPSLFLPGGIRPIIAGGKLREDRADSETSMQWNFRRFADGSFRITMEASATNPVAPYSLLVPGINYEVEFFFAPDGSVTVAGSHDGFPAYDFYFQQRQFHHYDPIALGATPLSLFPMAPDILVEEQRLR
jgi:hypothetical protein